MCEEVIYNSSNTSFLLIDEENSSDINVDNPHPPQLPTKGGPTVHHLQPGYSWQHCINIPPHQEGAAQLLQPAAGCAGDV